MSTEPHLNSITAAKRERIDYVAGLRAIADFLEENSDVPLPYGATLGRHYFEGERDEFIAAVRLLGRSAKDYIGSTMRVVRRFGPHEFAVQIDREAVCERVVVGTETVMVPDPDAPRIEREREVVEWRCHPLLTEAKATA